jgi:hypothetical protein
MMNNRQGHINVLIKNHIRHKGTLGFLMFLLALCGSKYLSKEQNDEVSDTTMFNQGTKACCKK